MKLNLFIIFLLLSLTGYSQTDIPAAIAHNQYATLNPNDAANTVKITSNGYPNYLIATTSGTTTGNVRATIGESSNDTWYFESTVIGNSVRLRIGVCSSSSSLTSVLGTDAVSWAYVLTSIFNNGATIQTGLHSLASGDVVSIVFKGGTSTTLDFYVNGSHIGTQITSGLPSTIYPAVAFQNVNGFWSCNFGGNQSVTPFVYYATINAIQPCKPGVFIIN